MVRKRKTVTIPFVFYETINQIRNDNLRLKIYDLIFKTFFECSELKIDEIKDDSLVSILIALKYEIKKVNTQFENGCSSKKLPKISEGFLGHFDESNLNQNEARFQNDSRASYYNNYNKSNNYIINNKQTNNNEFNFYNGSGDYFKLDEENFNRSKFFNESIQMHLMSSGFAEVEDKKTINRFSKISNLISIQKNPIKIKNEYLTPDFILENFLELLRGNPKDSVQQISEIFSTIDNNQKIVNKFKYEIGTLLKIALQK